MKYGRLNGLSENLANDYLKFWKQLLNPYNDTRFPNQEQHKLRFSPFRKISTNVGWGAINHVSLLCLTLKQISCLFQQYDIIKVKSQSLLRSSFLDKPYNTNTWSLDSTFISESKNCAMYNLDA